MTVKEAIQFAAQYLTERQLRSPRQDAELLLASILQRDRAFLYAYPECSLSAAQERLLRHWLKKRGDHYPLQYLREKQEFYGREFWVPPGVFIPRPETELLLEVGLKLLGKRSEKQLFAADVGTGCGCIAITLACEEPRVVITATDISPTALEVARCNAVTYRCLNRIEFYQGNTLEPVKDRRAYYHLVLSNPPYVSNRARNRVEPSVEKYEPIEAVFAGESGQEIYLRLFRKAKDLLSSEGKLVMELGYDTAGSIPRLAEENGWALSDLRKDLSGIDRCAIFGVRA
ncbi:peptide chain release factor N(5)-glutamine methyltransferase [Acidobacteria bacterium AH-259-O06]|nr:peptide chain release factor N(5)-glutamine methyltransferase [Acidobacteria bacterium AH-259-O06]